MVMRTGVSRTMVSSASIASGNMAEVLAVLQEGLNSPEHAEFEKGHVCKAKPLAKKYLQALGDASPISKHF